MNPETTLTNNQVRQICARHKIVYRSHSRIRTGFNHEVHRLNDDLLIKLFNTSRPRSFETELAMLKSDLEFSRPKFVAGYKGTGQKDRSYIIMSFVPGLSLGSKWHEATDEQRARLIKDISTILSAINRVDVKLVGDTSDNWQGMIEKRISKLTDILLQKNILTRQQEQQISASTQANKKYLANSKLYPVYWDIHFDNFVVDDSFELKAIIDLENVELCALDYPLFVIEKLMEEPRNYLQREHEQYADVKDYARLKDWYKKYYPDMFGFKNQNERVKLYLLMDTLRLLMDWPHVTSLYDKLNMLANP